MILYHEACEKENEQFLSQEIQPFSGVETHFNEDLSQKCP